MHSQYQLRALVQGSLVIRDPSSISRSDFAQRGAALLHYLGDWLQHLNTENTKLYAVVAIGLIIGQAVLLEWVTTLLFRLLRGRSE